VALSANGRRTSLFFPAPAAAPAVTPAAFAPPPPPPTPPMAMPGMQPGDVLLSVNGRAVGEAGQGEALARELAGGGDAVVQFERAGQVRTATLKTSPP
jgi:hypothetical protein